MNIYMSTDDEIFSSLKTMEFTLPDDAILNGGLMGLKHDEETKKQISISTQDYWDTNLGLLKKQRLSERNKQEQSERMKSMWQNPTEKMINRVCHGRPKGSKDLTKRIIRVNIRKIYAEGMLFDDAFEASKHFGIDPVNIRRKCRLNYNGNWRYLNENCNNN